MNLQLNKEQDKHITEQATKRDISKTAYIKNIIFDDMNLKKITKGTK